MVQLATIEGKLQECEGKKVVIRYDNGYNDIQTARGVLEFHTDEGVFLDTTDPPGSKDECSGYQVLRRKVTSIELA